MKVFKEKIRSYLEIKSSVDDPIGAAMTMVSSIQKLVGIHNVFGDKQRSCTVQSVFATLLFAGSFIYVGQLSQLIYLVQVFPDKIETFKTMNCISASSVPLSKFVFMWSARSRLKTVFELSRYGLSSIPEGSASKKRMLSTLQRARYVSWLVVANEAFTHITYLLMPFLFTVFGNDRYLPTTPGETYGLSPKYETPFYEITFVLTCVATAFSAINQTGYIVLFVTLICHELGHFYAITEALDEIHTILIKNERSRNNVGEERERESVDELIMFCVKHHQFLMHYHGKIRELYKMIFGAHFLSMTVVLVTTLQTMNAWDVRNTILTGVTGIMPLFLYCFGGEMLISAGLQMSTSVYSCGWELMEAKQARVILLMLCLSQRPLYLTAADIFVMNRETFGDVAQVVYKIYAVFN
ncbi:odorant receptor 10a-like [Spodoptera litura]|uniref:Odorant receptor n=1 Tax=Spodoptera litura TaxID=69820 RepID=A0A9J7DUR6_SPOLT|nr:odorant receptor 10a-like [Spodoptera litura]